VERLARADRRLAATVEQWDHDPWLLNTPSGIVNLKDGLLRPTRPDDYVTKMTAVAPSRKACPKWSMFLARVMGVTGAKDEEAAQAGRDMLNFLQRVTGYSLTGLTIEHAMFFLWGTGANGKSVWTTTVTSILGDYHKTAPMETFTASKHERHPTDLAGLQGARLVTAVETEEGRSWDQRKITQMTGGDRIPARFMRQDFFEFTPIFKLAIVGNHKPRIKTVNKAIRRRMNLIPFTVTITDQEKNIRLTDDLKEEWSGIMQWMIDGCLAWQSDGLARPKTVADATDEYLDAEDVIGAWISEECIYDVNHWESIAKLYGHFALWAKQSGEYVISKRDFSAKLEGQPGMRPKKFNHGRGFCGLKLNELRNNLV
jgi:putative DNA primase/helicase